MDIQTQFSKFATSYSQKNIIQKKIIQKYSKLLNNKSILDLGCGNGSLLCYTTPKEYIGIDFSQNMLSIHPNKNVFCFDFNTNECWEFIENQNFDILVSFSALQWANNLEFIFSKIKSLNKPFLVTLFTSNTFKTIHKTANITSPIHSKEEIITHSKTLNPNIEILNYKLYFNSKIEMFRYIKKSGVSGGRRYLSYKGIKTLIEKYPLDYLEFESITLKSKDIWK